MGCQKAQAMLEMIFADDYVTQALGMANRLREIRTTVDGLPGGALPEGLIKKLKQGLGSHIKSHYFRYYQAIGKELTNINRIRNRKLQMVQLMNSVVMVRRPAFSPRCIISWHM